MTCRASGISSKGAQTRLSTAPTAHVGCGPCRQTYVHPQAHCTTLHTTGTNNGDAVAPGRGWQGNPVSTKCSDRQRPTSEAPWRLSAFLERSLECYGAFQR